MTLGVGIITCKRPEFFKRCLKSIPPVDHLVIVNDCEPYSKTEYPENTHVIQHPENKGVATAKNDAIRHLMERGVEHIFLIEDDIEFLRNDVFHAYINAAKVSGIRHFNFTRSMVPNFCRYQKRYSPEISISFYFSTGQPFAYYHRSVIEEVGYYDEKYINDCEHHEFTHRIAEAEYTTPLMWFADLTNSPEYIKLPSGLFSASVIGPALRLKVWIPNQLRFFKQYGFFPWLHRSISKKSLKSLLAKLQNLTN